MNEPHDRKRPRGKVRLALAATLVALLVGGGAFAWWRNDQARFVREREARNAEAVAALLNQAEEALRAGDAARAAVALGAAKERSAEGGAENEAERLGRLDADLALLRDLDAIDQFRWTAIDGKAPDAAAVARRTWEALAKFGAGPNAGPEDEAAARVSASAVRERIVAALEQLADMAKLEKTAGPPVGRPDKGADPIHEVGRGLELRGRLEERTPAVVYQVKLAAGKDYVIDMLSPDQKALDPYLVLTDAQGKKLAEDDDGGDGNNARITFRPERDGAFRIRAAAVEGGRGDFTLTVREQPREAKGEKKVADKGEEAAKLKQARAHLKAGKRDLAVPLLVEVWESKKARLGADHSDTLNIMNQLGVVYWQLRRFGKSVPLFEEALKLREAKHGRGHPETLNSVANLGVNYMDVGRLKEAIPLLEEAHRAAKKHTELAWAVQPLIDAYSRAGEDAKLAALVTAELPALRKTLPPGSPQLAGLLAQAGMAFLKLGRWDEAEPLLRECLAIRKKVQPEVWTTANTQSMLGGVLLGQKKYADAETLLLAGYAGMKKREGTIPPQGRPRLVEAAQYLVRLYEALGRRDEVARWTKELEALRAAREGPEKER